MKMYAIGFIYSYAMENFITLRKKFSFFRNNPFTNFQKRVIHRKTAYTLVCLHSPLVSFCFTILSKSSKKWKYLTDFFDFFSKTNLSNLRVFFCFNDWTGFRKRLYLNFFKHENVALGKVNFVIFLTVFKSF